VVTEFLVIAGLSGAGRSSAANNLEDLGWFVIDNLPAPLFTKIAELSGRPADALDRIALVIGTGPYQDEAVRAIHDLRRTGARVRILFLDAATDVLVRRYEGTRRRHPVPGDGSLVAAIEAERAVLEAVKGEADVVVDTSDLNVHQLKARIGELFGEASPDSGMQTSIVSFGFKHGLPVDVDMVLDCRFLPNPHWVDSLRPLTGLDQAVADYVLDRPAAKEFVDRLEELLASLLPEFVAEGKAYLTVAFGCTGGRHRSVAVAEELGRRLRRRGIQLIVSHRDIHRCPEATGETAPVWWP
jgi:UPF0042 nucleotide-binding protein